METVGRRRILSGSLLGWLIKMVARPFSMKRKRGRSDLQRVDGPVLSLSLDNTQLWSDSTRRPPTWPLPSSRTISPRMPSGSV